MQESWFVRFAKGAALAAGRPLAFLVAAAIVVLWALTGPFFAFGDTWQLVINTGTTIITFLMVFLIQNSQNRDTHAIQIKLDELIRATHDAHNVLLDLEELDDTDLEKIKKRYQRLAANARRRLRDGEPDNGTPRVEANEGLD
ncbi:MAG: low affinity iron permease family protein [Fimbriimonadaceae bacterium]|nr:low affinity iron permease family protein [Fimbriimonadaceae bacterium]